ncbi:hypothetical protein BTZ20_0134 [Rhodococcus sp. MTM3W5.2]|nr:hypothetical protein BTZ20_0134 [Rhodococcus sp. MTM3W5.2]
MTPIIDNRHAITVLSRKPRRPVGHAVRCVHTQYIRARTDRLIPTPEIGSGTAAAGRARTTLGIRTGSFNTDCVHNCG